MFQALLCRTTGRGGERACPSTAAPSYCFRDFARMCRGWTQHNLQCYNLPGGALTDLGQQMGSWTGMVGRWADTLAQYIPRCAVPTFATQRFPAPGGRPVGGTAAAFGTKNCSCQAS